MKRKQLTAKEALQKLQVLCSHQEKCISEAQQKLSEWQVSSTDRNIIIEQLVDSKFIDEKRYAEAFVRQKIRINKWGKLKISYLLHQKRIDAAIVEQALALFEDDEYGEMISHEIMKKMSSLDESDVYKRKGKILQFGHSRGYESTCINDALVRLNVG